MQIAAIKWDCQRSMELCQCFSAGVHISGGSTRSCKRMCCISQAVLLHCGLTLTSHSRDIDRLECLGKSDSDLCECRTEPPLFF